MLYERQKKMSKLKKALEKAKETREQERPTSTSKDYRKYHQTRVKTSDDLDECRPELNIEYSKTRIKKIEDHVLKKGKVVSLFHDLEKIDQIKTLRTQVLNRLKEIGGNSLLVTSANPYEGKTFTAINLGVSIAQELDRTVLIVDCDLRNHSNFNHHKSFCKDFFGTQMDEGLSNYLLEQGELQDLLINPGIERLVLLPAGRSLPNSAEMLGSPRMEKLINDIKCRYPLDRVIIFDSSSLLKSADPLVLTRYVDGILFVVEEEKTTAEDLEKVTELLKDKPVIGTVMNKTKSVAN
jgi:non-specific protein-tyrosine kinase